MDGIKPFQLPRAPLRFDRGPKGPMVFDFIRKKWLLARPEEVVRQTLIHYMVYEKGYPPGLIVLEAGLCGSQKNFRADILVRDRAGSPWLLAECKAPGVKLDGEVLKQASNYGVRLGSDYILLCNGVACIYLNLKSLSNGWQQGAPDYSMEDS